MLNKGWAARATIAFVAMLAAFPATGAEARGTTQEDNKMTVGAYYFGGWAGRHELAEDPKEAWARNAPTHLTRRMIEEFPEREPVWGWRDDSIAIMEQQIDLAADHGLAFFAFCWYWHDDAKSINEEAISDDPKHTSLELFLKAKNNHRMKFCLLVANHQGFAIKGAEHWKQAADFWMRYLTHPQYLTVGGKPLLIIFNPSGGDKDGLTYLQEAARKAGLPGVAITGCENPPLEMGYAYRTQYAVVPGWARGPERHEYAELVAANRAAWSGSREQPCIPIVMCGLDRRPWEGPTGQNQEPGWYYPDRTPEQFANLVVDAVEWMDKHPEQTTPERIVLIYAWNEFGEGGYIAPTKGDPDGSYLKALRATTSAD